MKKQHFIKLSLAAAAVFGAMAGNASADGVTVFGIIDGGIANAKAPGASAETKFVSGGMTTSAIGFKGEEDLSGGLKGDFGVSSFIDLGTGGILGGIPTANMFAREAWVGIGGNFGHVSLGRDVNPSFLPVILFNAYGDSTTYSPLWHATYFDGYGIGYSTATGVLSQSHGLFNDTAWDGQVRYTSPNIGGATIDVNYAPNGGAGKSNYGANIMYFSGALGLTAFAMNTRTQSSGSTETLTDTTTIFDTNNSAKTYFVGGSYDFGVLKTFASYQEGKQSANELKAKTWHVSASIPVGPGKVLASFADTQFDDGAATFSSTETIKYKQAAIGYDYSLSKKTDLYVNYLYMKASDKDTTGRVLGAGIRTTF